MLGPEAKPPSSQSGIISGHSEIPLEPETLSVFCDPSFTRLSGTKQQLQLVSNTANYLPNNRWRLRMLARLTPLIGYIEDAATAYDVPIDLLLMVLLNESALNPLAIGPTDDKGLSQVTSDALTLLKGLSVNQESIFYNPKLFPASFSVFDPDFSICAGAAKLSWALREPKVDDYAEAYALYINPIHGLVMGETSERHQPLVEVMLKNKGMVQQLGTVFAVYEEQPELLSEAERQLVQLAQRVHSREVSLKDAYLQTLEIVHANQIDDLDIYQAMLSSYFGLAETTAQLLRH
jgi:hypothetical protein